MRRIAPGRAAYLSVLNDAGMMADDAIVSNNGGGEWMIVHGSGDTMALLGASTEGRNVDIAFDDDLHDISVQGPKALEILDVAASVNLAALPYFHHMPATLFGHACRISRTGYSGERGYRCFGCGRHLGSACGAGVMPCSFTALDKVRVEAGLLFYGYDMTDAHTPWEVGLGFTVSRSKGDFRGKTALMAALGKEQVRNVGLVVEHGDAATGALLVNGRTVGVINSPLPVAPDE